MRYIFSDKEIKQALKNMVILVDSREQRNEHILKWFDDKKIKYKVRKNDYGDYSCYIPGDILPGITKDLYFDTEISIERKANIDELANNLKAENRPRLKSEFAHMKLYDIKCHLFIEDINFDDNIRKGNYRSCYNGKALNGSIEGLLAQYNISFQAVDKQYIAAKIYNKLYYFVRNRLIREFVIKGEK